MAREIAKAYDPQQIEKRWAEFWVRENLFRADPQAPGPVFSIVIPPPNVTGSLHIGHMLDHTEIDILARWHRMRGFNTLYLPGMDHAGISTQRVVVKKLADEGIDYRKLGREEFERRVWQWKADSGGAIIGQMKQIGESCDWTRERFTLSPELSRVVTEVFVRLYEQGLIYRAHYLINWCPNCLTALSDLEVNHEEQDGNLWYIRYPVAGSSEFVVVATTRPETMLGDTAVAVNPDDERYQHLVGKKLTLPLTNREIPVIADSMVDREFGTGAVKITPAHDPNDFAAGRRHNLPEIDVMTGEGRMNSNAGGYQGLDRFAARKKIVEDLEARGLLEKTTAHTLSVGLCERCKTVVEPRASDQWFCKMRSLADQAMQAVERNDVRIVPENRREEFFHWMRNIRDWVISRQLWWGHRIPAWHCGNCGKVTVARTTPARCAHCGSERLSQDEDVLDTWFSSALWPFSTLGWPEATVDYRTYYPTSALITGYDILFFWVARMVMMGLHLTGQVPFRSVYLHSLVRTSGGEKMSKSKGTGLDPVALNEKFGTDAMRFCLTSMAAPGTDIVLSEDRLLGARSFANKIWNAARFLFVNLDKFEAEGAKLESLAATGVREKAPYAFRGSVPLIDAWLFARLATTLDIVKSAFEAYRFHEAVQNIYQFFWNDFCDWYIEWVKPELNGADRDRAAVAWQNLFAAFDCALRLLHPVMPFLTEELWHQLPQRPGARSISLERYPEAQAAWRNDAALREFALMQEVITTVRAIRADMKLDPKKRIAAEFSSGDPAVRSAVETNLDGILRLALLTELKISAEKMPQAGGAVRSTSLFDLRIVYTETVDMAAECTRLRKEHERLAKNIAAKEQQLADTTFRSRAPERIIQGLLSTLAEQRIELGKTAERLSQLNCG
ncbi:MAG TPA: valine--tRNA ligase [Candidatus Acidoferrum sp.]|nr:valine--tRNA ligase [Candidatus Acidoferrum sp.]